MTSSSQPGGADLKFGIHAIFVNLVVLSLWNFGDLGRESGGWGKVVHPVITLLRTATGATSLPHRRKRGIGTMDNPHTRRRSLSTPAILAGALSFDSDRQVYALDIILLSIHCCDTRFDRAYFRIVNFTSTLKGIRACARVPRTVAASDVEKAVTRRALSEQQRVAPSNLAYWPTPVGEKEIKQ